MRALLLSREADPAAVAELDAAVAEGCEASVELLCCRRDSLPLWGHVSVTPVLALAADWSSGFEEEQHGSSSRETDLHSAVCIGTSSCTFLNRLSRLVSTFGSRYQLTCPEFRQDRLTGLSCLLCSSKGLLAGLEC